MMRPPLNLSVPPFRQPVPWLDSMEPGPFFGHADSGMMGRMHGPSPDLPFMQFPAGPLLGPTPTRQPQTLFGYPPMPGLPPPPWPHIPLREETEEESPPPHVTVLPVTDGVSSVTLSAPAVACLPVPPLSITSSSMGRVATRNNIRGQRRGNHRTQQDEVRPVGPSRGHGRGHNSRGRRGQQHDSNSTSNSSLRHQHPNNNRPLSDACRPGNVISVSDLHINNHNSALAAFNGVNVSGGTGGSATNGGNARSRPGDIDASGGAG